MIKKVYELFSNDIGIDLGTANTLVYLKGEGIVINEPSVVAINTKTGRVVAVGTGAKQMLGRTPGHIKAIRPLVDGVISDFEITEEMLSYFINKANNLSKRTVRPRVVVGVPSGITNVEIRAVHDAVKNAGAREVHIVEEPMAAAIGIDLPVHEADGIMVIDIGGGTTDIAVIALSGIVRAKSLKIAGDKLNTDIIAYIKDEFRILIGEKTAESIKISIGTVSASENIETEIRGRDLVSGLPKQITITSLDVREAILASVMQIVESSKEVLETTPPEVLSDIMQTGVVVTGGGALIHGIKELFEKELRIPVLVAVDPLSAVVVGTGKILDNVDLYSDVLLKHHDDLPPR
jgi:rod shape-determining protein MreB and related proteins